MATRLYKIEPGEGEFQVTEGTGSAVASDTVELTVDLAATRVNAGSGQRAITKQEVLEAIDKIKNHIIKGNWPPA
jgi:hypothetical protein